MTASRQFYAIAPTQFSLDGRLDARATAANVERATEFGVSRFLLCGAYGEFQSLSDQERIRLVEAVKETCPQVAIMAGAVHPSTHASLDLANRLFGAGADEVMAAAPAMSEVSDHDILRHFAVLRDGVQGPLVLYNNPAFGIEVSPRLISRLAEMSAVRAVKQGTTSSRDFIDSVAAAHDAPKPLRLLAASDLTAISSLSTGADGLTSTNFWAFPSSLVTLARTAATADHTTSLNIHRALKPFFDLVSALGQPRAIKAAMEMRGFAGSPFVRYPYEPLSEDERRSVNEVILGVDEALAEVPPALGEKAS